METSASNDADQISRPSRAHPLHEAMDTSPAPCVPAPRRQQNAWDPYPLVPAQISTAAHSQARAESDSETHETPAENVPHITPPPGSPASLPRWRPPLRSVSHPLGRQPPPSSFQLPRPHLPLTRSASHKQSAPLAASRTSLAPILRYSPLAATCQPSQRPRPPALGVSRYTGYMHPPV